MAQRHKGPRRGFLVRWADEDGLRAKAQAAAAGMTINDYLTQLVRRDQIDRDGCPVCVGYERRDDVGARA